MTEILLAIIAAELGFAVLLGIGIFALEFYSLFTRYKAMQSEDGLTKIRLTPEEMSDLLGGKGLPSSLQTPGKKSVAEAADAKHGVYA